MLLASNFVHHGRLGLAMKLSKGLRKAVELLEFMLMLMLMGERTFDVSSVACSES